MNDDSSVFELFAHLALLSLMAVGGGLVMIAPDVRDFVVGNKHWLLDEQFTAAYAIAQAAPGPNLLFISLVGWLVAGWFGAIGCTVAVILPSTLLTLFVIRMRARKIRGTLSRAIGDAFTPISIGLLGATAWLFAQASNATWAADAMTMASAFIVLRTKLNPVVLIAVGAVLGIAHLV